MVLKSSPAAKFFKCQKISTLISVYFCRRMLRTRIARIILQCGMAKENASGECSGWNTKEKRMGSLSNTFVPDSSPVISLYFSLVQGAYMALIQLFNNHYCFCRGYITESRLLEFSWNFGKLLTLLISIVCSISLITTVLEGILLIGSLAIWHTGSSLFSLLQHVLNQNQLYVVQSSLS